MIRTVQIKNAHMMSLEVIAARPVCGRLAI
jgi:hypothetical protein